MRSNNCSQSFLETECLFGEEVEILDEYAEYVYCKLLTDNYYGWIEKDSLGKKTKTTHRVLNTRTFIYQDKNEKSNTLIYLPMGSKLAVKNIEGQWAEISFFIKNKIEVGYVPSKHVVDINHKTSDWVNIAEQLEGTPYRWGGRDTIGIDCSALLQLSYQTYGEIIPRNSSQQMMLRKKSIHKISDLKRGCVIFWKRHVAIMVDEINCVHANAFHMKTFTEPLIDVINRMDKSNCIAIMLDFN
jgi:cell wall-associated NlpC family hydrolase